MSNKTCGECKYFNGLAHGFCKNKQGRLSVQMNNPICKNYKQKPTNGDKIRQMSNRELAEYFVYETGVMWTSTLIVDKTFDTYEEAIAATVAKLKEVAE